MTQKLRVVLVALVVSLLSQASFAQYAASTQLVADTELTTPLHDGQRLTNVGKTVMLTGASGSQAESWWMGIKAECLGLELHTMGLTVGKSF